jgi:hypothetical protein
MSTYNVTPALKASRRLKSMRKLEKEAPSSLDPIMSLYHNSTTVSDPLRGEKVNLKGRVTTLMFPDGMQCVDMPSKRSHPVGPTLYHSPFSDLSSSIGLSCLQRKKGCFATFNPVGAAAYREVISRWVVILLVLLENVAESSAHEANI